MAGTSFLADDADHPDRGWRAGRSPARDRTSVPDTIAEIPRRRQGDRQRPAPGRRILIVERSARGIVGMARDLEALDDLEIVTACETWYAEALLRTERFDLVVLDERMCGLFGLDFVGVLRRRDPDAALLVVTAAAEPRASIQRLCRRADDHLCREDLTREILLAAADRLLAQVHRRRTAAVDTLTGLFCHRALEDRIEDACARLARHGEEFSLLLIDLVTVGDDRRHCGPARGNHLLRRIAGILPAALRPRDRAARYRGDAVCVLAPGTGARRAEGLAERLRECIRRVEFTAEDHWSALDCVVGVGCFANAAPATPQAAIATARTAARGSGQAAPGAIRVLCADDGRRTGTIDEPA